MHRNTVLIFCLGYAKCKNCKHLLRCGTGVGTTTMNTHLCTGRTAAIGNTSAISSHFGKFSKQITTEDKKAVTDVLAYFCAKDLRPFEVSNFVHLLCT